MSEALMESLEAERDEYKKQAIVVSEILALLLVQNEKLYLDEDTVLAGIPDSDKEIACVWMPDSNRYVVYLK